MAFSALLDTCVLVPSFQRDLILELASAGSFRPVWSDQIEIELTKTLHAVRQNQGISTADTSIYISRLLSQMNHALPDARIRIADYKVEGSISSVPDPDDEHVVLAAVLGRADVIVTNNLRDFPSSALPKTVFAQHPDEFLLDLHGLYPELVWEALRTIAARTGVKGMKFDVATILQKLRTNLPKLCEVLTDER